MKANMCVVFDMDDTLYLERQYVRSGFEAVQQHLMSRFDAQNFADRAWTEFLNGCRGKIIDRALLACGIMPCKELISELVEVYRSHAPNISLLQDSLECLRELAGIFNIALLTDGPLLSQQSKSHALKLSRWMQPMIFTEELGRGRGKPHPAGFQKIQKMLRCAGENCVYVADNPQKDFSAPRALSWKTVRVRRELGLHFKLPSGPDVWRQIDSLSELKSLLC